MGASEVLASDVPQRRLRISWRCLQDALEVP